MTTPTFSIIIPTYNRADGRLQRALDSVAMQTWRDWECIVVDDGSKDTTEEDIHYMYADSDERFRYIRHDQRQGRVIARNTGMEAARGEWFALLDSDDAWDQEYLRTVAHSIEQQPEVRLWIVGAIVHGIGGEPHARTVPVWTKIRRAWLPPVDTNGAHALFDSGRVGTGMFLFHRECYETVGPLPPWQHPDHIADGIDELVGLPFGTMGYGSGKRERETDAPPLLRKRGAGHVGNPWGEDHAMFLALTRHYRAHIVGKGPALYIHYVR